MAFVVLCVVWVLPVSGLLLRVFTVSFLSVRPACILLYPLILFFSSFFYTTSFSLNSVGAIESWDRNGFNTTLLIANLI